MTSPLDLQFAFVTYQLPRDTQALPKNLEIVLGLDVGLVEQELPIKVPLTLIHGWIEKSGRYVFGYRIFDPTGSLMANSAPPIEITLHGEWPFYLCFHHLDFVVRSFGQFQIEAMCNGEVALRYPFAVSEPMRLP